MLQLHADASRCWSCRASDRGAAAAWSRPLPSEPTASTVGRRRGARLGRSRAARCRRPSRARRTSGCCCRRWRTHASTSPARAAAAAPARPAAAAATLARPTSVSSAMRLVRRSFSAAISCAVARSKRACASRVSVMVAVPTSKLRLADGQLLGDRRLAGAREGQRVLRRQHVEVGLRDAHDQVLLGGLEVGLRDLERLARLLDGGVVGAVEQRLPALTAPSCAVGAVARRRSACRRRCAMLLSVAGSALGRRSASTCSTRYCAESASARAAR